MDLRTPSQFDDILNKSNLDPSFPTFIIAECVLVYLKQENTLNLLNYFTQKFNNLALIEYEVINPFDEFGKRMKENLQERNCILFGIDDTPDVESHIKRFKTTGFSQSEVFCMLDLYNKIINKEEKNLIEKIEMMDEFEEWNLIQSHYCFGVGVKFDEKTHLELGNYFKLEKL